MYQAISRYIIKSKNWTLNINVQQRSIILVKSIKKVSTTRKHGQGGFYIVQLLTGCECVSRQSSFHIVHMIEYTYWLHPLRGAHEKCGLHSVRLTAL